VAARLVEIIVFSTGCVPATRGGTPARAGWFEESDFFDVSSRALAASCEYRRFFNFISSDWAELQASPTRRPR